MKLTDTHAIMRRGSSVQGFAERIKTQLGSPDLAKWLKTEYSTGGYGMTLEDGTHATVVFRPRDGITITAGDEVEYIDWQWAALFTREAFGVEYVPCDAACAHFHATGGSGKVRDGRCLVDDYGIGGEHDYRKVFAGGNPTAVCHKPEQRAVAQTMQLF
jgi:hypothetical protein